MDKFELLKSLLVHVETYYENEDNPQSLDAFIIWLAMQLDQSSSTDNLSNANKFGDADDKTKNAIANLDNGIGILNSLMYRYSRMYSKVALEHSAKLSLEEFSFLVSLSTFEGCTKTELINIMIFEKSTGIEIIKRLVNAQLASEEINPYDKRSKLLKVTEKGKKLLYSAFAQMTLVSKEITAILDLSEKKALHHILVKLEKYHRNNIDANIERLKKQFEDL